ncbi:hypothetical protein CPC08DRAFT_25218 [Agrocybe pediades]|nr:hypothetical protein CPC08DRAFT_25218 [Agrocybe pediades]
MPTNEEGHEVKNTETRKPKPRRLFSFDSIKTGSSRRSSDFDASFKGIRRLNPFDLSNVEEGDSDLDGTTITPARATKGDETLVDRPLYDPFGDQTTSPGLEPVRPFPLRPKRSLTTDLQQQTFSPTRARWENVRQHFLPPTRSSTPPPRPPSAQGSVSNVPPRSNTPKPSRLGRLGLRQVVDQAQDQANDTRKLIEDITRGCAAVRYPDMLKHAREREVNASLTGTAGTLASTATGKKLDHHRRLQSVSSISLPSNLAATSAPSIRFLYQVLVNHSAPDKSLVSEYLPLENQVLSTLLIPFLQPVNFLPSGLEEEKTTAIDSFELLCNRWLPPDEAATVDRILWCTKAASNLSPCPARKRILGLLWKLIVPGDRKRILLTMEGFQSISSALLILLSSLYQSSLPAPGHRQSFLASPPSTPASYFLSASADFQNPPHPDIHMLQDLIPQLLSGSLGELDDDRLEEVYGAQFEMADRRNMGTIRKAVFMDAVFLTIEHTPGTGEWLFCNVIEHYWGTPAAEPKSTLQAAICGRRLSSFCRFSSMVLRPFLSQSSNESPNVNSMTRSLSSSSSTSLDTVLFQRKSEQMPYQIVAVLQSGVIPELKALDDVPDLDEKEVLVIRVKVANVLLQLLCLELDTDVAQSPSGDVFGSISPRRLDDSFGGLKGVVKTAMTIIAQWYRGTDGSSWKAVIETALRKIIIAGWTTCVPIISSILKYIPVDLKKNLFSFIMPILNDQLVEDPPPNPCSGLSKFLVSLSKSQPPVFFKPLFACAASDKEVIVVNHLCTLQVHSNYVGDYWFRDVDMMCMALLGDATPSTASSNASAFGVARLGQLVLLVELTGQIQEVRRKKESLLGMPDGSLAEIMRFVTSLETRLWTMVETKERSMFLPASQRMLLSILFREIRLLTKSTRPAPWLQRALEWFKVYYAPDAEDLEREVVSSTERIQGLYIAAQDGVQQGQKRRSSVLGAHVLKNKQNVQLQSTATLDLVAAFARNRKVIDSLSKGYTSRAMKLFVTMSTLIPELEYSSLGPILWEHCLLDNIDSSSTASACFLLMQCAEKTSLDLLAIIEVDLQTSDDTTRLEAVRKIGILVNCRFQIITQNFVMDRTHRPFKLARPPLPFLATDIGSSLYIHVEDPNESRNKDDVPLELRQRLAELGWAEENAVVVDPRQEWIKTPMSILPANQLDRLEVINNTEMLLTPSLSPNSSPQPSPRKARIQGHRSQTEEASALLRRNSSSGGPASGVKRRAIFVPPLSTVFTRVASLVFDENYAIASAARTTVLDLMRNDPALLTRPILDGLSGDAKDIGQAVSTLTALLHVNRQLPPPFTHNVFNNLAGFLKTLSRNAEATDSLRDFALVLPVLSSVATQVSGMSIKEIRRSKIEHFVVPTGTLWFTPTAPKGYMFPRHLKKSNNPFETVPPDLVSITMIRVSQNLFFLSMLKKNQQDVQVIRRNMTQLILPSLDDQSSTKTLDAFDLVPRRYQPDYRPPTKNHTVEILSMMLARSYILLVTQIFRSMPRHLNDRNELAILIDGLNRALVVHGDDVNIVSQVIIAYMVASSRFRRLFTTGGGYTLFMPALVKIYTETPDHPGIHAVIEYAISRFYALHKDSFLYQSINVIGQLSMFADLDIEWFSKGVFDLFASLRKGAVPLTADAVGIRDATKAEEREDLIIHTVDEKPQTFFAAVGRTETKTGRQMLLRLPEEYETHRLSMDNFVRLFLTIIAHDLSIARAQHFLRLLRFLTPHLYNASASTRTVLADGTIALGAILNKNSKPKGGEPGLKTSAQEEDSAFLGTEKASLSDQTGLQDHRTPSDWKAIRLEYLHLILAFGRTGGQVTLTVVRHAIDVLKGLLKEWGDGNTEILSNFLRDLVKMLLDREEAPSSKAVVAFLREIAPILHMHTIVSLDLTGVFQSILSLAKIQTYTDDRHFCEVLVNEICTAGLLACDLAMSENRLMSLQYRPTLISLLAVCIFFKGVDVIGHIEKRAPTYQYLAGVVLPLTLVMKTEAQCMLDGFMNDADRKMLAVAWVRVLFYAITACERSRKDDTSMEERGRGLTGSFRSKSDRNRQDASFWRSHLPTFMMGLQVIKVVVVRGSADISSMPRIGIWERLSVFFATMFTEGSADFALRQDPNSPVVTPTASPRASSQFDSSTTSSNLNVFSSVSSNLSRSTSLHLEPPRELRRPRIVDYCLWSMSELVCAYRSPLRMQLKLLMMEKVLALDRELQYQKGGTRTLSPFLTSPSSRRVSASLFSRSRQRNSTSLAPSPDASPRIMPSSLGAMPAQSLLEIPTRRAGYQISPITPRNDSGLPKIVHLGPTSPSAFPPAPSPIIGGGPADARLSRVSSDSNETVIAARATKIRSLKLIQETYRRIRGVQLFMGYDLLLPMPGSGEESADAAFGTWSKQQALAAIMKEAKDLLEEFEEAFSPDDDSIMVVEVEPRVSFTSDSTS